MGEERERRVRLFLGRDAIVRDQEARHYPMIQAALE